ncbi:hypothetical protein D3C79_914630 [compost metagenome]
MLLLGGKHIHQAIDGFRRRPGVYRGQHQVPGFRRSQRQAYRLRVAQLTEHDHIRVLTQRRTQCLGKTMAVPADLALTDPATLRAVDKLDGVLEGDDMQWPLAVQVIDQGREGG